MDAGVGRNLGLVNRARKVGLDRQMRAPCRTDRARPAPGRSQRSHSGESPRRVEAFLLREKGDSSSRWHALTCGVPASAHGRIRWRVFRDSSSFAKRQSDDSRLTIAPTEDSRLMALQSARFRAAYARGNVRPMVDVNQCPKNTSAISRALRQPADTVGVTCRGSRATRHVQGRVRPPDRTFRVKDWLDRSWRKQPCELLVPTPTFPACHCHCQSHAAKFALEMIQRDLPVIIALAHANARRANHAVPARAHAIRSSNLKETLLDEMEHGFWQRL